MCNKITCESPAGVYVQEFHYREAVVLPKKILTRGYKSTQATSTSREPNGCKLERPCLQQAVLWLLTRGV